MNIECMRAMLLIMSLSQKATRKWVDYSDDSEEQFNSEEQTQNKGQQRPARSGEGAINGSVDHRSQQFVQQQLARYRQARQNSQQIWLLLESDNQSLLDKKIRDLKDNQDRDILNIYMSREGPGAWDIKMRESAVQKWIIEGVDRQKNIKVTVAERNFKGRGERGDRPRDRGEHGDRGDRGDRRGRRDRQRGGGRGGRDRQRGGGRDGDRKRNRDGNTEPQKKKVYVDKATGQAPTNKQQCQKKVMEQKERHYTRQEAERVGEGLGNFRNKPKVQTPVEEIAVKPEIKPEYKRQTRPRDEPKVWARKQRQQLKEQEKRQTQYQRKDKKVDSQQIKEKKPDIQQVRERKVQYRQKVPESSNVSQQETKVSEPEPQKKKTKRHYVRVDNLTQQQKAKLKLKKPVKKQKDMLSEDSN